MGGGAKIRYPKHVWSPAGGWYCQPANWKANTAIMAGVAFGLCALVFNLSAEREFRNKHPEQGRFFPSRWWSRQLVDRERELAAEKASKS